MGQSGGRGPVRVGVEPLQRRVVPGLRQQLKTHGRLSLPFGPGEGKGSGTQEVHSLPLILFFLYLLICLYIYRSVY